MSQRLEPYPPQPPPSRRNEPVIQRPSGPCGWPLTDRESRHNRPQPRARTALWRALGYFVYFAQNKQHKQQGEKKNTRRRRATAASRSGHEQTVLLACQKSNNATSRRRAAKRRKKIKPFVAPSRFEVPFSLMVLLFVKERHEKPPALHPLCPASAVSLFLTPRLVSSARLPRFSRLLKPGQAADPQVPTGRPARRTWTLIDKRRGRAGDAGDRSGCKHVRVSTRGYFMLHECGCG